MIRTVWVIGGEMLESVVPYESTVGKTYEGLVLYKSYVETCINYDVVRIIEIIRAHMDTDGS